MSGKPSWHAKFGLSEASAKGLSGKTIYSHVINRSCDLFGLVVLAVPRSGLRRQDVCVGRFSDGCYQKPIGVAASLPEASRQSPRTHDD